MTQSVSGLAVEWSKTEKAIVIDTPGIGDSEGRDTENIAKMVLSLK
jgi:predicted GTPase